MHKSLLKKSRKMHNGSFSTVVSKTLHAKRRFRFFFFLFAHNDNQFCFCWRSQGWGGVFGVKQGKFPWFDWSIRRRTQRDCYMPFSNWCPPKSGNGRQVKPIYIHCQTFVYPQITYYWTVPLILNHSYLFGKWKNCWYKSVRISEVLKRLFQ